MTVKLWFLYVHTHDTHTPISKSKGESTIALLYRLSLKRKYSSLWAPRYVTSLNLHKLF